MKRREFLGVASAAVVAAGLGIAIPTAEAKQIIKTDMQGTKYNCKWKKTGSRRWYKRKWVWVKRKVCTKLN